MADDSALIAFLSVSIAILLAISIIFLVDMDHLGYAALLFSILLHAAGLAAGIALVAFVFIW